MHTHVKPWKVSFSINKKLIRGVRLLRSCMVCTCGMGVGVDGDGDNVVDGDGTIVLGQVMAMSTLTSEAVALAIENLYVAISLPFPRNHLLTYHLLTSSPRFFCMNG